VGRLRLDREVREAKQTPFLRVLGVSVVESRPATIDDFTTETRSARTKAFDVFSTASV
jgi:hypothetical protein